MKKLLLLVFLFSAAFVKGQVLVNGFKHGVHTYATWNPTDKAANITLSGGNLTAVGITSQDNVRATIAKTSGKWYWEITPSGSITSFAVGVTTGATTLTTAFTDQAGYGVNDVGQKGHAGSYIGGYTPAYSAGDVISVLLDLDGGTIVIWKNGVSYGTMYTGLSGSFYPAVQGYTILTANFGATSFSYTPPAGYNAGIY